MTASRWLPSFSGVQTELDTSDLMSRGFTSSRLAAALLPSQDLRERGAAAELREPLILQNTNNDETASIFQQVLKKNTHTTCVFLTDVQTELWSGSGNGQEEEEEEVGREQLWWKCSGGKRRSSFELLHHTNAASC